MHGPFDVTPGHRFTPDVFRISADEVASYRRAVDDHGAYAVPPLLLVARALRHLMAQFDIVPGTIHGGQECEFFGAPPVGRPLRLEASVIRAATRRGQRFLTLAMDIWDGDDLRCRGRASLVFPPPADRDGG